jgi:hemolysin activation/secretion protein
VALKPSLATATVWLALYCSLHNPAQAQQALDTQQLQRQQQREDALQRARQPGPSADPPPAPATPSAKLPADESPCAVVHHIRLSGPGADTFAWLTASAAGPGHDDGPLHRCIGATGIALLQARLQSALVQAGYLTSRVLVGPQNLADTGELTLTLVPGVLGAVRFSPDSTTTRPRLALGALPVSNGDPLRLPDIEQGLENLKRLSSVEADIQIVPIEKTTADTGGSDLLLFYRQGRALRLNLGLDDGGTRATGRRQGTATVSWDNPLALNDLLYLSLGHSLEQRDSRGTRSATLAYSVPWGYWLFSATASQNRYHQSVAGASQAYVFSGSSENAELGVKRVVWRTASARSTLGLRTWRRSSASFIDDTEIEVQRRVTALWELAGSHRQYLNDTVVDATLALRQGSGAYGALRAPEEAFGEGNSRMRITLADLGISRPLRIGEQRLRLGSNWHAQWNQTPLTPQDRIAIGSRYTVRGFDGESSLLAERGWFWRNDLGWSVAAGAEAYLGIDAGRVGGDSAAWLAGRSLAGGVLGVRGTRFGLAYDVFMGRPIHKPAAFRTAATTVGLNLSYGF